jgi:rod shape determining protein RodA
VSFKFFLYQDFVLVFVTLFLVSFGILMISSTDPSFALQQLLFSLLGFLVFFIFSGLDWRLFKSMAFPLWLAVLFLLLILPIFGEPIRGATRWIDLGFFRFQPSELAKPVLILALAWFFDKRYSFSPKNIIISFFFVFPYLILIFRQPDLGNAFIIFLIWASIVFISGLPFLLAFLGLVFTGLALPVLWFFLAAYQKARIFSFLDPTLDPLGTGYNIIQSQIAIGSGQLFGRGFGRGTQSLLAFLPERQTDFIFATLSEELGLFGASILLLVFLILVIHLLDIAKISAKRFPALISIGVATWILVQIVINVGMNLGIVPVTGITLPLISYGGSSLISTLLGLGIINSFYRHYRKGSLTV